MGKNKGAKQSNEKAAAVPVEIEPVPGFFGQVIKPGQALVWDNEVEEFALQLTSAALGSKVASGRSTLFATAKDAKVALCTLVPEKTEQWNLAHLFTAYDGPVVLECEGVNEIHLTGLIDVQDEEDDHDHDHDHDHDDDESDDDDEDMAGTYSDSDDDGEVMIFDGEDDDSEEDDEEETEDEDAEKRFEVIEERVHGDIAEKKKETPKKEAAAAKKETPKKEATPTKKEATPIKKEANPAKEAAKKEAAPVKKAAKKDEKKSVADKVAEASTNSKKRPAPSDSVDVPKKAKTTRLYKGVTIEEVAIGKGQPAAKGRKVSILYRGRLENGKQFDANQNRKKPFIFRHGIGDVIKGMDIGIEGMRAGGKRTITIPSHLGYGKSGAPPSIPGNSTLIFEIEML